MMDMFECSSSRSELYVSNQLIDADPFISGVCRSLGRQCMQTIGTIAVVAAVVVATVLTHFTIRITGSSSSISGGDDRNRYCSLLVNEGVVQMSHVSSVEMDACLSEGSLELFLSNYTCSSELVK